MANPELKIVISGNADKFQKELKELEKEALNTDNRLNENRKKLYKQAAVGIAATTAAVGLSLKAFANYESALVAAARTTGLAGKELDDFAKNIDDISGRLNTPREQLLKIAEVAGTLGITGADNLAKFTETMAKFDVASATLKGEEAANSIARIINLTGGGIENVENFASEIAYLADNFKSTEAETVAIAEELARLNAKIPLSTENTIALAAAFADLGITPEIARTGLSEFASTLDKALREGGKELQIFTTLTGMTREELQKTFLDSPEKVFTAFSKGLGAAGEDASFVLSQLGLDQSRLAGLFLASAQNSDVLTRAISEGNKAAEENTKLNEETAKVLATTASKWDGLKAAVGRVTAEIGEKLAPTANATFAGLTAWLDAIYKDLNEDIPNALKTFSNLFQQIFLGAGIQISQWIQSLTYAMDTLILKAAEAVEKITPGDQSNLVLSASVRRDRNFSISNQQIEKDQERLNQLFKEFEELHTQTVAEGEQTRAEIRTDAQAAEIEQNAEHQETKAEIQAMIDEAEAERLAEQREEELERKQEQFDEDMELLQDRLDQAVALQNNALVKDLANQKKALQEKAKLDGLKVKGTMEVTQAEMQLRQIAVADAVAGFQRMFKEGTAMSKALFLIGKAAAVAEGIVNTNVAYTKALAQSANPAYAQLIWAAGMLKVALIGATAIKEVGGAQQGGIVPGFGSGDRVPMMLEPGELVVPKQIRPNFEEHMRNVGGGTGAGGGYLIELDPEAARIFTLKQREDSKLGVQR